MENQLISRLKEILPGAILDIQPLGRSGLLSVWIEMSSILKIVKILCKEKEWWLENLSVMQIEDALVLNYFIYSRPENRQLVLRGTVLLDSSEAHVEVPSVIEFWPMAQPMEQEAREFFGIHFIGKSKTSAPVRTILPTDWRGFPLRKSYVWSY